MLYFLAFITSSIFTFASEFRGFIVVSEFTSQSLVSDFKSLVVSSEIPILELSNSTIPASALLNTNLIFDFTEALVYRTELKNFANANRILYFSNKENSFPFISKWEFSLHPPPLVEAKALQTLVEYFNWTDFHLLSSQTSASRAIFSSLSSSPLEILSNDASQEVFDRYTAKVIKPSGNWKIVFTGEEQGTAKLLVSFEKSNIFKERSVLVLASKGSIGLSKLGTIAIVEEGLENTQTEAEFEFRAILRVFNLLDSLLSNFNGTLVSNEILAQKLEENNSNHVVSSRYSIVNVKETLKIVGTIEDTSIELREEILFPGNLTEVDSSPPEILISANTGPYEWDGSFNFLTVALSAGLQPMVQIVNDDSSILSNFNLRLHETDCGYLYFKQEYTPMCMEKHMEKLGLAHVTAALTTTTESYLRLFKDNRILIPNIGFAYTNMTAYDKALFPELLVTTPKPIHYHVILPYIIRNFGWDQIILIYNKDIDPIFQSAFVDNAKILNIEILNSENYMYVPYIKTDSYYNEVKHILQFIKDSKCRIIVLMADPSSHLFFMEALYKFGFRRGEVVLIYVSALSQPMEYPEQYNFDRDKVLELADGSLSIIFAEYIGEYGEKLKQQIKSIIEPFSTDYTCFRIDSLMLAVQTIDFMVNIGRDFEDFEEIMHFMRGIRFTGCSGQVSIDSSGNGLSDIIYYINNFYVTDEGWKEENIGSYTLGITVPLKYYEKIRWPNGATETPSDMIEDPECGFPDNLVATNETSLIITIILTTVPLLCVCACSFCLYRRLRSVERDFLEEKRQMYFEDGAFLYLPLLEALQIIGLGPDFYTANPHLSFVCRLVIFELGLVMDFEFDTFWRVIYLGFGVCIAWSICLVLSSCEIEKKLPTMMGDFIEAVGFTFIPVFARVLFIPMNVLLMNIYDCKRGIGDELTESFLEKDCKTWCWQDKQLVFAILITIALAAYNCLAIVSAVFYDEAKEYVSIKTRMLYAFLKPMFLLILVSIRFNLKDDFDWIFSLVQCVCLVLWTLMLFKIVSHNYKRLNMWVRVISAAVCAHQILIATYRTCSIPEVSVIIAEAVLVLGLVAVGFTLQIKYFPSMLFRKKGRNFQKLLNFTFTSRVKAYQLTEQELDYRDFTIKIR